MITVEQIRNWEINNGESFIEDHEYNLDVEQFYQTLLQTFPELDANLKEIREKNSIFKLEIISFQFLVEYPDYDNGGETYSEKNYDKFLQIYCDMVNDDENLVKIVNKELTYIMDNYVLSNFSQNYVNEFDSTGKNLLSTIFTTEIELKLNK